MATLLINYAVINCNYYGLLFSNISWLEIAKHHLQIQKELGNFLHQLCYIYILLLFNVILSFMTIGTVANQELSAFLATAFISVKLPARPEIVLAPPTEFPELPEV